jgi:hypothetical protein
VLTPPHLCSTTWLLLRLPVWRLSDRWPTPLPAVHLVLASRDARRDRGCVPLQALTVTSSCTEQPAPG